MNLPLSGFCESLEATEMMWIVNLHHRSRWACLAKQRSLIPLHFQVQENGAEWNGVERSLGNGHIGFDNSRTLIMRDTSERDIGLHETDFWVKTIFDTSQSCQVYRVNITSESNQDQDHSEVVQVEQRWNQEREDHYYICFLIPAVNRKHQSPSCFGYLHWHSMQVERKVRKIEFDLMIPFKNVPMINIAKHCIFNENKFSYCQNVIFNAHITERYKI